jgi:hypothetical protein
MGVGLPRLLAWLRNVAAALLFRALGALGVIWLNMFMSYSYYTSTIAIGGTVATAIQKRQREATNYFGAHQLKKRCLSRILGQPP